MLASPLALLLCLMPFTPLPQEEGDHEILVLGKRLLTEAKAKQEAGAWLDAIGLAERARSAFLTLSELYSAQGKTTKIRPLNDLVRQCTQLIRLANDARKAAPAKSSKGSSPKAKADPSSPAPPAPPSPPTSPKNPAPPASKPPAVKSPVPMGAALEEAEKLVLEIFGAEFKKEGPGVKRALALNLLVQALQTTDDSAARYVLLREAHRVATQGVEIDVAHRVIDLLEMLYPIDTPAWRDRTLEEAERAARNGDQFSTVGRALLDHAKRLTEVPNFSDATLALRTADRLARRAKDVALDEWVDEYRRLLPELREEHEEASKVNLKVAIDMQSHKANLNVGRYLLFQEGDGDRGFEYLLWSGPSGLTAIAEEELKSQESGTSQVRLAESWMAAAEKERSQLQKDRYYDRARYWLTRASENATGLLKTRIEKRTAEINRAHRGSIDVLALVRPSQDTVAGTWVMEDGNLVCKERGRFIRLQLPYIPPEEYDLYLEMERVAGGDAVEVGLSSGGHSIRHGLDSYGMKLSGLEVGRKDMNIPENGTARVGRIFFDGTPTSLVYSVRKDHISASANGKTILLWHGPFKNLTVFRQWHVRNMRALWLGTWNTELVVRKILLVPRAPGGTLLR